MPGVGSATFPFLAGGNLGTWKSPDLLGWFGEKDWFLVSDVASIGGGS